MLLDWLKISDDDIAKNVLELKAIKYLRVQLRIINLWPRRELGEQEPKWPYLTFVHLFNGCIGIFGFAYIATNVHLLPLVEMGHNYITSMLNLVCMGKLTSYNYGPNYLQSRLPLALSMKYKEVSRDFFNKFHLFHLRNRSAYAMKTYLFINKVTYILMIYTIMLIVIGTSLFNITPLIINYVTGMYNNDDTRNITKKFTYPVNFRMPFNTETSLGNHIFLNVHIWITSYFTMDAILFVDIYMCFMVLHIWGCFKILINELETLPRPKAVNEPGNSYRNLTYYAEMYSPIEMVLIKEKLKEIIVLHYQLITFIDQMSNVFGPILFVYNVFHLITCCLLLLEFSKMDMKALALYGPLTIGLFQHMIELNVVFELLGSVNDKMKDAVYNLPWECMDKSSRYTVLIFLMKVQEPVHVKALGMVNIGVTNMAAILKTSISYFAFLRTVAAE